MNNTNSSSAKPSEGSDLSGEQPDENPIIEIVDDDGQDDAAPQEYIHVHSVETFGATAPDGRPWVGVIPLNRGDRPIVWTPLIDWGDDAAPAKKRLRDHNLHLFGDDMKDCVEAARKTWRFPPMPLITQSGWTGLYYGAPWGEAFSPAASEPATVVYDGDPGRYSSNGNKTWLREVARLAKDQPIITFVLMIAFVGPLLRLSRISFNPGFEITGPSRVGKTSLQQLLASIVGQAAAPDGKNAWLPANITTSALEALLPNHNDFVMIIEEMSLFYADASEKTRGIKLRDLVFKLASGTGKSRYQSVEQPQARFAYLTSSNATLSGLLGSTECRTSAAAGNRLLTIPISAEPFGIFDCLPDGAESSEAAVRAITNLVEDHYGKPIRRFIPRLVQERARSENKLKRKIARHMDHFRAAVGVDENVGPEASIADVFGLAYAAGRLAKEYGALPKSLKCLSAAVKVYRMNRELGGLPPSHVERLRRLALRKGVIQVDPKRLLDLSNSDIAAAPALVRPDRQGRKELLMTEGQLERAFPLKREFFNDQEVQAVMQFDADKRRTVKRTVRTSKRQERFYVFVLTANENDN